MEMQRLKSFKSLLGYFLLFVLLCLPAFFSYKDIKQQQVKVIYPKQKRALASRKSSQSAEVAQKTCQSQSLWRYKCDSENKKCVKDRQQTYLDCKPL